MAPYGSLYGDDKNKYDAEDALLTSKTGAKVAEDPTKKGGTATPMDSPPAVIEGEYPEGVDWIKKGENYAGRGKNANKLRATMRVLNGLPADPEKGLFQEQAERVKGDIFRSGRQLDNAGDITHCMFVSAACVFMMINEFLPEVGIRIVAGNNQFYRNFKDSKGRRLDNNHVKGRAVNFEIMNIDNEKVKNGTLTEEELDIIDEVETILQRVAAGNRHFQYINEYDLESQDGDPRYNFHMSLSGRCCFEDKNGGIYIEYDEDDEIVRQGTHWWNSFLGDSINLSTEEDNTVIPYRKGYDPTNWEGEFDGYVEGVRYKEISIGRALLNGIEIVDMNDVVSGFNLEGFEKEELADEMFKDCGGGHRVVGDRDGIDIGLEIDFPSIDKDKKDHSINISFDWLKRKNKKTKNKKTKGRGRIRRRKPQYSTKFSVLCPRKRRGDGWSN